MVHLRWLWTSALCLVTMATSDPLDHWLFGLEDFLNQEQQLSSVPQRGFFLPIEITNKVFTSALSSPASQEYQTLYKEVSELLDNIYDCPNHTICPTNTFYGGVVHMTFSSGSVIANATVVFNTAYVNPNVVYAYFTRNAPNIPQKTLQLNMGYTTIDRIIETTVSGTSTTRPTTTPTTPPTTITTTTTTTTTAPTTTTTTTVPTTTTTPTTTTPTTTTPTTTTPTTTTPTTTTPTTTTPTTTTPTTTTPTTTTPTTTTPTTTTPTTTTPTTTTPTTTTPTTTTPTTTTPTTTTPTTTTPSTRDPKSAVPTTPKPTSSAITKASSDDIVLVSTTKSNHGNHSDINPTDGGENITADPPAHSNATLNPHNRHTGVQSASTRKPNSPLTSDGSSTAGGSDWVPGWGIALLVLAAAILLLLIIIFIMMLVRWCCKKTESGQMDTTEDPYYSEKKPLPQDALPVYSPQPPVQQNLGPTPVIVGDTPKKNKTGFYAVNP